MTVLRSIGQKLGPPRSVKVRTAEKMVDPFYTSPEWRALMDQIIKERGRRCEDPEHDPAKQRTGIRIFGDHIKERRDAPHLALVKTNILLRCGACHTRKTADERRRRYQGDGGQNP
jgi:hypothetical protein